MKRKGMIEQVHCLVDMHFGCKGERTIAEFYLTLSYHIVRTDVCYDLNGFGKFAMLVLVVLVYSL